MGKLNSLVQLMVYIHYIYIYIYMCIYIFTYITYILYIIYILYILYEYIIYMLYIYDIYWLLFFNNDNFFLVILHFFLSLSLFNLSCTKKYQVYNLYCVMHTLCFCYVMYYSVGNMYWWTFFKGLHLLLFPKNYICFR